MFTGRRRQQDFRTRILLFAAVYVSMVSWTSSPGVWAEGATQTATYTVTFDATWSSSTHPMSFPPSPHFSGLIGGTHNNLVDFWLPGQLASDGIELMAEIGSKTPLDSEVQSAINAGNASAILSGGGINPSPGSVALSFTIDQDFPLVTLVSMIAPSPDWFVGVHGLSLFENGNWVSSKVVDLFPYDAGTDSGSSYTSANQDTQPPDPITLINSPPAGNGVPFGTFTFTRTDDPAQVPATSWAVLVGLSLALLAVGALVLRKRTKAA